MGVFFREEKKCLYHIIINEFTCWFQQDNLWKPGHSLEDMFGIDIIKCRDILQKAGLQSLGKSQDIFKNSGGGGGGVNSLNNKLEVHGRDDLIENLIAFIYTCIDIIIQFVFVIF